MSEVTLYQSIKFSKQTRLINVDKKSVLYGLIRTTECKSLISKRQNNLFLVPVIGMTQTLKCVKPKQKNFYDLNISKDFKNLRTHSLRKHRHSSY